MDEQPYKIPDNWQWTTLGKIANWGSGGTPLKKHSEYYNGNIHWIKTGDLNNDYIYDSEEKITLNGLKNSSAKLYPINTIVIAMYGATVGKVGILGIEAATNQACACAICNSTIHFKYLFYYLISQKDTFILISRGSAQPNISQSIIKNYPMPLPPLTEQERIIKTIETLSNKLDNARIIAQKIVDSYELRRSVILHKAFNISYVKVKLSKLLSVSKETTTDFSNPNLKYICLDNIKKDCGIVSYKNTEKIKSTKNVFKMGQILYGKLRPYLNKHDVAKFDGVCSTDIIVFNHCDNTLADYINYYFDTEKFINYIVPKAKGNTLPRVTKKDVLEAECPLPPYEKQKEIVHILDNLLSKEQRTKELAEQVLQKIDLMKKTILARAFRGEL